MKPEIATAFVALSLSLCSSEASDFQNPDRIHYPETWFHLIGGNVSREALSVDLEAVNTAGLSGIQLFHGRGQDWPDVETPIQTLSPEWDSLLGHIVDETERLDLKFTMQNCPGWAMSGGPWITPENAMRHIRWSATYIQNRADETITLPQPESTELDWHDYQDIAVIAFPSPKGDTGKKVKPIAYRSNRPEVDWNRALTHPFSSRTDIVVPPGRIPTWVEFDFAEETTLRALELPPTEYLTIRRIFHPNLKIKVEALTADGPITVAYRDFPRGNWQDKDWDSRPVSLALSDAKAKTYRITFEHENPISPSSIRFSTKASVNDWQGQSGFVLRSRDFSAHPKQSSDAFIERDQILDLSDKLTNGTLDWKPPAGNWTILRIGHANTGTKNKPAPPEATGWECDKLSTRGADQHFPGYIGRVSAPGGPADDGRLKGMLIDSWECFTQTWTPNMAADFQERRGYGMKQFFPAILGYVVEDHQTTERFLRDWRATISDLMVDNYFGRLAEHARARGMTLSFEAAAGDVAIGDILQYFSKADIPMTEYWTPNDPHNGGFEAKPVHPAASAAHIYGKDRVAAEAFTQYPLDWSAHPFKLKHLADRHYAGGVNHVVFHTFTHNPSLKLVPGTSFGSIIGSPFIRNQTWWKHMPEFTDYLARCNATLQRGQPVADVLWFLGDALDHKPRQDLSFPEGYKFDYLNADALNNHLSVAQTTLQNKRGTRWKLIWLNPETCRELTLSTLRRLEELIRSGATVVGPAPLQRAGLAGGRQADLSFEKRVSTLWNSKTGDRKIGKGRLIWGNGLQAALDTLGIEPDVSGTRNGNWIHRRTHNSDIYFVTAHRDAPLKANLRFRSTGQPELWNPITGETNTIAAFKSENGHTTLPVHLPVAGSAFIVFKHTQAQPLFETLSLEGRAIIDPTDAHRIDSTPTPSTLGLTRSDEVQPRFHDPLPPATATENPNQLVAWQGGTYTFTKADGSEKTTRIDLPGIKPLTGPWTLSFPEGWGAPESITLDELKPWTELDDEETKAFSGTATYRAIFTLPALQATQRAMLELGQVGEIAEVTLNGQKIATLWTSPHRCEITSALQTGENQIEIAVTNTWFNRLAYDHAKPEVERKTWTKFAPKAGSELKPSGLLGTVSIVFGQEMSVN